MLIGIAGCQSGEHRAVSRPAQGAFPAHVQWLLNTVPQVAPEDLMSAAGQTYMQQLPAVGREDLKAAQTDWPLRPRLCEPLDDASQPIDAIVTAAQHTRIVIINEAHDRPRHRAFIRETAAALRPLGYRRYAAETFSEAVSSRGDYRYPLIEQGHYVNEPVFGQLLRALLALGYRFEPYEYTPNGEGLDAHARASLREEGQARNLSRIVDSLDRDERLLIHVGFSHAAEVPIDSFGGKKLAWMASRLKDKTGTDPLTVDQTACSLPESGPALARSPKRHVPGQFDLVVGHRGLKFEEGRPVWRRQVGGRAVRVPPALLSASERVLIEARYASEPPEEVPADRLLLRPGEQLPLILLPAEYRITAFFEHSRRVVTEPLTVN
ncbi:MAG: hypothetical protein AAGA23_12870 [Pseudomonadota bacterium]